MHRYVKLGKILVRCLGYWWVCGLLMIPLPVVAGEGTDHPSVVGQVVGAVGGAATDMVAGVYILLDHNLSALNKLIKAQQWDEAESYYQHNKDALDKVGATKKLLSRLSQGLNEHYAAGALAITASLEPLAQGVPDASSWAGIKVALQQGKTMVDAYNKIGLLHDPVYRSAAIDALNRTLDSSHAQLMEGIGKSFTQYPHDAPDFFDRYPETVDADKKSEIVEEHRAAWLNRLASLDQDKALMLIKAYAPWLHSETAKTDLSAAYMKALAVWGHWSSPLPIDKAWSLGHEFQAAGIDEKLIPLKRVVLIITGTVPGPVPAGWEVGCSTDHVPCLLSSLADLDHQISELSMHGYSYFLILDPRRRASVDVWQLTIPESEHAAGAIAPTVPAGVQATRIATVQRTIRQQVGIYFLDAQKKLIYGSRMDAKQIVDGHINAPGPQADMVMAQLHQAEDAVLLPAKKVVPALLDEPISAVSLASFDITQQISDDAEIFQHKNMERQQQVVEGNAHIASLMGLSLESVQDKPTQLTDLKPPVTVDCKQLREVASDGSLKSLWGATLGALGRIKDGALQNSYVFLESMDDISGLREAMAKGAAQPDVMLAALKKAAMTIQQRVGRLQHLPVGQAPSEASAFLAVWLNQYASNLVVSHAQRAMPHAEGQLFQEYDDIYNQIAMSGGQHLDSLLSQADERLKDAVKLLAQEDASTVQELNAVTPQTLSAAIGAGLLATCSH